MKPKQYTSAMVIAAWALRHWQYNPDISSGFSTPAIARALRVSRPTVERMLGYEHTENSDPQAIIDAIRAIENVSDPYTIIPDAPPQAEQRPQAEIVRDRMLASLIRATEIVESGLDSAPSISEALRVAKEWVTLLPKVQSVIAAVQDDEPEPEDVDELLDYLRKQRRSIDERIKSLSRAKENLP